MKVSVLITNYNRHALCEEAVASVLRQGYKDIEVIVVDDGSESKNPHLEKYKSQGITYLRQENSGQAAALNSAYQSSSGQIICLLDSDDLQDEDYIYSATDFFNTQAGCDVLYTTPIPFRQPQDLSSERGVHKRILSLSPSGIVAGYGLMCATKPYAWIGNPSSGIVMRRSAAAQLFPLYVPKGWSLAADQILCQKIALTGQSVYRTNQIGFYYRVHPGNGYFSRTARIHYELTRDSVLAATLMAIDCRLSKSNLISQFWKKKRAVGLLVLLLNYLVRVPQLPFLR